MKRVLRDDGTLWLNIADTYVAAPHGKTHKSAPDLKVKDLVGIPARVQLALQADGWYYRRDIVWEKVNGMPEAVEDRPTGGHEFVLLFSKRAKYFYDPDAVRKPVPGAPEMLQGWSETSNLRSVWKISARPYRGAHFAVFPVDIPTACILAATSERGVCPECGEPWRRVVERRRVLQGNARGAIAGKGHSTTQVRPGHDVRRGPVSIRRTSGWKLRCGHADNEVPATVLDPLAGVLTTGLAAKQLGRRAILIELSTRYINLGIKRFPQEVLA